MVVLLMQLYVTATITGYYDGLGRHYFMAVITGYNCHY